MERNGGGPFRPGCASQDELPPSGDTSSIGSTLTPGTTASQTPEFRAWRLLKARGAAVLSHECREGRASLSNCDALPSEVRVWNRQDRVNECHVQRRSYQPIRAVRKPTEKVFVAGTRMTHWIVLAAVLLALDASGQSQYTADPSFTVTGSRRPGPASSATRNGIKPGLSVDINRYV